MRVLGFEPWQVWTRLLQIVGLVGCLITELWFWGAEIYYCSRGPYGPVPERGWTVPLPWTHGFYGTFEEKQLLHRLFDWGWWSIFVLFIGTWNRLYREKKELGKNKYSDGNSWERLPMNWPYVGTAALIATTAIGFIVWSVTAPVYRAWTHGLQMTGGWNSTVAIIWDAGCLSVLWAFYWKLYNDAHVEMGETELRRPSVFGLRRIRWSEIVRVAQVGFGYHVFSKDYKIVLSPYAYKHPESVISTLKSRIESNQGKRQIGQGPD